MEKLISMLKQVQDPRRNGGNKKYDLAMILLVAIMAIAKKRTTFRSMRMTAISQIDIISEFFGVPSRIPHEETFRRTLAKISPDELAKILQFGIPIAGDRIAIDGKYIRETEDKINVVSAWNVRMKQVVDQEIVPKSSNEIIAVKTMLKRFEFENCIFTGDAINCQTEIAQMIVDGKNDYVLAVKGNQPCLLENAEAILGNGNTKYTDKQVEYSHGRVEVREYGFTTQIENIPDIDSWPGAKSVCFAYRKMYNKKTNEENSEVRFFISSLDELKTIAKCIRGHWAIENQLHWRLDAIFEEDSCRVRKGKTPAVLNILRKFVLQLFDNFGNKKDSLPSKIELVQDSKSSLVKLLSSI